MARPVDPVTGRLVVGTHGILVGEYDSDSQAVIHMIIRRGTNFARYNLYKSDENGPNWTLIGRYHR